MNKLNLQYLAKENLRSKPFRSFALILLVLVFSFILLAGSLVTTSLASGVESLSDRLGADIMIVPAGHEGDIDSILLTGSPSGFYLPSNTMEVLAGNPAVAKMTPQTYIATLSASCCSYPVQIIGIDEETDYLIKPWLEENTHHDLEVGEVIIGNRVEGQIGQILKFFGTPYKIVGRLEQTGMGFDATVFVNQESAANLIKASERKQEKLLSEDGSLISTVMIKLNQGYDSVEVARAITKAHADEGIFAMYSKKFVNNISSNLQAIMKLVRSAIVVIWILSVIVLAMVFTMILRERKKEFAILRILGARKSHLKSLILRESFMISLFGSCLGISLGLVFVFFYGRELAGAMSIPFLLPNNIGIALWTLVAFIISLLIAPLASLFAIRSLSKWDVYSQFREDE